jgi:sugar phosphate isomerase/epimerase
VKLACSSSAYDVALREGRMDLRAFLRVCADDLDVDGVSIAAAHVTTTDGIYLRDLKKLCIDSCLTIGSVEVDAPLVAAEGRDAEIARVGEWCDVAAFLGAPVLALRAGAMPQPRPHDPGRIVGFFRRVFGEAPPNVRRAWSDTMWALRQCADYAATRGVAIAVRNERAALIDAPHQLWQSVRDAGSPWLRTCPDPAAMRDRTALDLPLEYAIDVEVTFGEVRDDGSDAATHWPEILRLLRAARYRGFVTLGYRGADPAEAAMPRAARYMRGLLHLLARQEMLVSPNADEPTEQSNAVASEYRVIEPQPDADSALREILARR